MKIETLVKYLTHAEIDALILEKGGRFISVADLTIFLIDKGKSATEIEGIIKGITC